MLNSRVIRYRERLWPGPWTFAATLLLIPAGLLVFLPIDTTIGVVAAVALFAIAIVILIATTPTLLVTDREFVAGRARLPLDAIGSVEAITGQDAVLARGRELDARAWLLLRGWVRDVVRVEVTDPADPVPYWLVSTRNAERLAEALRG